MSAQAGVFFFDRRPIDPILIANLGRHLAPFGPDAMGSYTADGLAMVYRALHVTPEDCVEHQPYVSAHGNVVTWDGRLDNRQELLFELWHDIGPDISDAALALVAYERWGPAGLRRLVGDWACAIFDRAQRSVIFASDYMGIRPLYAYASPEAVWWATTLECLVTELGLYDELEPRFVAGVLSNAVSPGLTPYKGITAIPAACSVQVASDGERHTAPFWTFDVAPIRYRTMEDYEVHLRDLFLHAVGARLRSTQPVWAELSGGLDSSSVVCAAHILTQAGAAPARRLETVSYVADAAGPDGDERRYAELVDAFRGCASHYLVHSGESDRDEWSWVTPRYPSAALRQAYALMRQGNARLLVGGEGGDTVMGNYRDHYYDVAGLLHRPAAALELARRRALAAQHSIWHVLREACWERLPADWLARRRLAEVVRRTSPHRGESDATLADVFGLRPAFVAWWREEQARSVRRVLQVGDVAHRRLAGELVRLADGRHMQMSEEPSILRSYPYLDRALVEFVLAIPMEILAPPGHPRGLMKRAFAPFVPARVIGRFSKGYAAPSIVRNAKPIAAHWLRTPDTMQLLHQECVDRTRLLRYLQSVCDNAQMELGVFTAIFALEQWLGARQRRCAAVSGKSRMKGGDYLGVSQAIARTGGTR